MISLENLKKYKLKKRYVATTLIIAAVAVCGIAGISKSKEIKYETKPIERCTITQVVEASGTINPVNTVSVGSTVSGLIKEIFVDYNDVVKKGQILNTCGMSFMHGAQDGQKFIGILIIFICLLRKTPIPENAIPLDYIGIIIFTAVVMAIGCSVGGKKIVDNIGTQMATLNIQDGFISDVTTIITLLIASLTRFTN